MKKLENFVRDNRDDFDLRLPSPELWDRIENELRGKAHKKFSWIKVASGIAAILVVALVTTFLINKGNNKDGVANVSDPEMKELLETEAYYASEVSGKMSEIQKCYNIYPELKADIESDLNELNNMYNDLKKDLKDNVYNREVIEAMIQNNRLKLELVNRVLEQVNC
jgi:hypothetical protein